jgi:hypothetical protein
MLRLLTGAALAVVLAQAASAGECAEISQDAALQLELLQTIGFEGAVSLVTFCASCGDKTAVITPISPDKRFSISMEPSGNFSVSLGDEKVDLTYLYLATETAPPVIRAESLAHRIGCTLSPATPRLMTINSDGSAHVQPEI